MSVIRADDTSNGLTTIQQYDRLGRLQLESTEGETRTIWTNYFYDAQGRLEGVSVPSYNYLIALRTTYKYDDLDRVTVVTHPDDTTLQTQYSGWSHQRVIDENEHVTDYALDAMGRVKAVTEYTGTLTGQLDQYATTTYMLMIFRTT